MRMKQLTVHFKWPNKINKYLGESRKDFEIIWMIYWCPLMDVASGSFALLTHATSSR